MDDAAMKEALEHDGKRKAVEAKAATPVYPPEVLAKLDTVLKETAAQTQALLDARAKEVAEEVARNARAHAEDVARVARERRQAHRLGIATEMLGKMVVPRNLASAGIAARREAARAALNLADILLEEAVMAGLLEKPEKPAQSEQAGATPKSKG